MALGGPTAGPSSWSWVALRLAHHHALGGPDDVPMVGPIIMALGGPDDGATAGPSHGPGWP